VLDYISLGLTFFIGLVISIIAIAAGSLKDFMVLTLLGTWFFLVVIMLIFNKLVKNYKGGQK
jgi:antibiotic biosynthesis monooxygenase (ABM) superfamily enzyme